jgi:hypothetical protein
MKLLAGTVKVCTTITAIPKPIAVEIFLDTAKKVHIPKKNDNAKFSMKIALTNKLI